MSSSDRPDWLARVHDTLAALGLLDEALRDEIVRQVEEAVSEAAHHDEDLTTPSIQVLRGGRSAGPDPEEDDERTVARGDLRDLTSPRLHLVDGEDEHGRPVRVQVVRPEPAVGTPARAADLSDGHLRLPPDEATWQTFVHGESPSAYRVHCDEGALLLASEADVFLRLEAGQSVDLTGLALRARSAAPAPARGRYRRLAGDA